jgi:pyridoxal kinase
MVFALEKLGLPVWAVQTVSLAWHPGHGPSTRIVPHAEEFAALMADLSRSPKLAEIGAIITGYLGAPEQAGPIAALVRAVKAANPKAIYLCDPVTGDRAGLYVPEATAHAIRDELLPLADLATPNRFELEWLAQRPCKGIAACVEAARCLTPSRVIVTSVSGDDPSRIGNLLVAAKRADLVLHQRIDNPPNGPGDLIAALTVGHMLKGLDEADALQRASASVFEVLELATRRGADELALEADAHVVNAPSFLPAITRFKGERPTNVAGVDGCKAGWVAVWRTDGAPPRSGAFASFADLVAFLPQDTVIAVDMPIGLPDRIGPEGRGPEARVRKMLGARQSSVFSIPSRAAIYAEEGPFATLQDFYDAHTRASRLARETSDPPRAISIQAFAIFDKIREIDRLLVERPELRGRIVEAHPEVAFWRLNDRAPMQSPKKVKGKVNVAGMKERQELLCERAGFDRQLLSAKQPKGVGADDLLDAATVMVVAERFAAGEAISFPDPPLADAHGIAIAIRA